MKKNKAYKYRIYPTKNQQVLFNKTFGCVRFVYNKMLNDKKEYYDLHKETLKLTPAKYKEEFEWLKEVDSLALCNAQLNLDDAYNNFFDKRAEFPNYKKKKHDASYTTNCVNNNIRIEGGLIKLPKVGYIKVKLHRNIPEGCKIKSTTINKTSSGKYFISILTECEVDLVEKIIIKDSTTIGLDYSSSNFFVDSNRNTCNYNHYYRESEKKLGKAQRRLSKKKKGSSNYKKQHKKVAKISEKVANQRYDFLHKESTSIAKKWDTVCLEDINLRNLAQCLKLGKSTNDNGFGIFRNLLKYKLEDRGKHLVVIDKWFPSSKTCSNCGHIKKDLELKDRIYICPNCQIEIDRDYNAAINIKKEGLRLLTEKSIAA